MPYYVYILECENKTLYTGITTDLKRRFRQHREGRGGHYTRANRPGKIRYHETQPDRSAATKRERWIKELSRAEKLSLIKRKKKPLQARACRGL